MFVHKAFTKNIDVFLLAMVAIWSSEKLSHFLTFVQTTNALKTDSRLVARQILAEYGEEVATKEKKKKKPKKNQDILELKVRLLSLSLLYIFGSYI
jgi:hypothetical protein